MSRKHFKKLVHREIPDEYTMPKWHSNMTEEEMDIYFDQVLPLKPLPLRRMRAQTIFCTICGIDVPITDLSNIDQDVCNDCLRRRAITHEIEKKLEQARHAIDIAKQLADNHDIPIPAELHSLISDFATIEL
jgi:hypothetical protein